MDGAASGAICSGTIFLSSTPWMILVLVLGFIWLRRERATEAMIHDLDMKYLAEIKELIRLHGLREENMRKIHEKDLAILRNAKNLVWLRVSDGGVYECPGCGHRQEPGPMN